MVGGRAAAVRIEHTLDQFHRVLFLHRVQLPSMPRRVERRGERLAAGEDEPRLAHPQQAFAQGEDGLEFLAGVLRENVVQRFSAFRAALR